MAGNIANLKISEHMKPQTEGFTRTQKDWLAHFDKAVREYLREAEQNGLSKTTIDNYTGRINQFRVYMIDKEGCADITPERLYGFRQWLVERGLGNATVRQYIVEISTFLEWCTWEEHKFYDIKIPTHLLPKNKRVPYGKLLTADDVTKLVTWKTTSKGKPVTDSAYIRRRALSIIMLTMGLRVSEVCTLQAKDIDLDQGTIFVAHGKGDKQRLLAMPKVAYDSVQMYMEEGDHPDFRENREAYVFGTMYRGERWRRLSRQAAGQLASNYGIEQLGRKLNPHLLRHAAASFSYLNGASIEDVRQFLGHSFQSTTKLYIQRMFQTVSAPGIENIWNRLDYESEKGTRAVEEQKGIKIRRMNVVEKEYIMIASDAEGNEYELSINAESAESARMKAVVYCNRSGLALKQNANGTYRIHEAKVAGDE